MSHVKLQCSELFQQPKAFQIHLKTCHRAKICHKALGLVNPRKHTYCKRKMASTQKENREHFDLIYIEVLGYAVPRFKFLYSFD